MNKQNQENRADRKRKTEAALNGIKKLPLIPKVMFEVTKMLHDQTANTNTLATLIGKDQGLTAKILSVANSPLYGLSRKVTSLEFAIIVLGFKEISDIVTAISLNDAIKASSDKYFDQNEFWVHSMVTGTAARGIAQSLGYLDMGSDAFVAGVLHELGIQVIHRFLHPQYIQIMELVCSNPEMDYMEAEMEILGLTHQDAGRFLAEKWNLPDVLCDTLSFHHLPGSMKVNRVLPAVIHLADYMTQRFQVACVPWDRNISLDRDIIDILQFSSEENIEKFIVDFEELFIQTANSIRI